MQPEEEEEVQGKFLQRQEEEEVQRLNEEEEGPVQPMMLHRQPEVDEEEEPVQAKGDKGNSSKISPLVESGINSLRGGGQPLTESTLSFFEPRFGVDFSGVRVHTNTRASNAAKSLNAKAFTSGHNVVFGTGQYKPETYEGRKLLSHELTHVIQQRTSDIHLQRKVTYEEYKQEQKSREEALERGIKQEISERLFSIEEIKIITNLTKLYPLEAQEKDKNEILSSVIRKLTRIAENTPIDLENYKKAEGQYAKWGFHYQKDDAENSAVELLFFESGKGLLRYELHQGEKKKSLKVRIYYDAKGEVRQKYEGKIWKYKRTRSSLEKELRKKYVEKYQESTIEEFKKFTAEKGAESGLPDIWELTKDRYRQSSNPNVGVGKELADAFEKILQRAHGYDDKLGAWTFKKDALIFDQVWQKKELLRLESDLKKLEEIRNKKTKELDNIKADREKIIAEIKNSRGEEIEKFDNETKNKLAALASETGIDAKSKKDKRRILIVDYNKGRKEIISKYTKKLTMIQEEYTAKEKEFYDSQLKVVKQQITEIEGLVWWLKNQAITELENTKNWLEIEADSWNKKLSRIKSKKQRESTAARLRRMTAAKLCNVISYYLFLRAIGKTKLELSEYYLQEVKRGRIGVEVTYTKVSAPFFGWGTTSLQEQKNLKRVGKDKYTKLNDEQINMFLSSNAKVAISHQDTKNDKKANHFFLIIKDKRGIWRNVDHTSPVYDRRGGETNFDKVYGLVFDENTLRKEGKRMVKDVQQSVEKGSFIDEILSPVQNVFQ